ncbi:hypothetical protein TNCV_2375301 [Trichonephila clavipes]|nr:hypothetical protein TNCV_2375301 [Trichonephila clavipes]
MSRSGGQSEARPPVFKSPSKLGTHLSTHCSRDERDTHSNQYRYASYFQQKFLLGLNPYLELYNICDYLKYYGYTVYISYNQNPSASF